MNRIFLLITALVLTPLAFAGNASADAERRVHVDAGGYALEVSSNAGSYGSRLGGVLRVTSAPAAGQLGFTGLAELVTETRNDPGRELTGVYLGLGAIHDWNDRVFTYTAGGFGNDLPFVEFNLHQELGIKLLRDRRTVLSTGGGYVRYHEGQDAPYILVGATHYWSGIFSDDPNVILQYQFRSYDAESAPERLQTHIAVVSLGQADSGWLRLRYVRGREAFSVATNGVASFESDHVEQVLSLEHERSVGERTGFTIGLDVLRRRDEISNATLYDAVGFNFRLRRNI